MTHALALLLQIPNSFEGELIASAITAGLALVGTFITQAFYYGRYTERVVNLEKHNREHGRVHESLDNEQDRQWHEIGELNKSVAHLEGKVNGRAQGK